jgi:uncharacterized protein (DUF433 family)
MTSNHHLTERIVASREVLHGKPRIAGTRIPVTVILDLLAAGKTSDDILGPDYYPDLTEADIRACIALIPGNLLDA